MKLLLFLLIIPLAITGIWYLVEKNKLTTVLLWLLAAFCLWGLFKNGHDKNGGTRQTIFGNKRS